MYLRLKLGVKCARAESGRYLITNISHSLEALITVLYRLTENLVKKHILQVLLLIKTTVIFHWDPLEFWGFPPFSPFSVLTLMNKSFPMKPLDIKQ